MKCKNCRHWGAAKNPFVYSVDGMRGCDRPQNAKMVDSDEYPASLTAAEFGCVLFAAHPPDAAMVAAIVRLVAPHTHDLIGANGDTITIGDASTVIARINGGEPFVLERENGQKIRIEARKYGQGLVRVDVWPTEVTVS